MKTPRQFPVAPAHILALRAVVCATLGLAALALVALPSPAAVIEAWVQRYNNLVTNGHAQDVAFKVLCDAAGDIVVAGYTQNRFLDLKYPSEAGKDMLTIKYSATDGSMLWQRRYNGPADNYDYATAVAVDGSGNVIVTGNSWNGWTNRSDYYTAKYAAADGALLWERRYNGPANGEDYANAVAVDGNGNVVVTGSSWNTTNELDYYTVKYAAADGALLWEKRYNGAGNNNDRPYAMAVDRSGNVVVTGSSNGDYYVGSDNDYYTAKYAAMDGALLWEQRGNGGGYALTVDVNGNAFVTGSSWNGTNNDYYTAKYAAADGALLWEKRHNDPANDADYAQAVAVDSSGNVVVTGFSDYSVFGWRQSDYYTAKYAAVDGVLLWEKRHAGPAYSDGIRPALALDGGDNVILTGYSWNGTNDDYYTAKYAVADGALLWERHYDSPAKSQDYATAAVVDPRGNVVVSGVSYNGAWYSPTPDSDCYTAKYAAADGALLWEQRYDGLATVGANDEARAVAVDRSGNVVVTGSSGNGPYTSDYYTAKYGATDGRLLWEKRFHAPGNWQHATALALDNSGNVVVTGFSGELFRADDYYTAKYAAANGSLLWEQRYDGGGHDNAAAVAVDRSGNVVVTGSSATNYYSASDYYTAKYAAADGALVWEQRYNGPGNSSDFAHALAVDSSGNVIVTGSSYGDGTGRDYYTAKYAATDGTLLWEQRFAGFSDDEARALAVDGNGNVVVTGNSAGDYFTLKYAAADGELLWEQRYTGPAHYSFDYRRAAAVDAGGDVFVTGSSTHMGGHDDHYTAKYAACDGALIWEQRYSLGCAAALAVDSSGNAVVTGYSYYNPGGNADYYIVKYAAVDGVLLWEKGYNGPANGNDFATGLAIGPHGIIAVTGSSDGDPGDTRSDYATVVYWENLPSVSIALIPAGVRIRFAGVPDGSYQVQRAVAVAGPWSTMATRTAPIGGIIEYVDTNPPIGSAFYRTSTP